MMSKNLLMASAISAMAMAMLEMVYEGILGAGFWSAPIFISATFIRSLQEISIPVGFMLVPVALGIMLHMVNSHVLTIVFEKIYSKFNLGKMGAVFSGMFYGIFIYLVMWFIVLPIIDPVMLNLNPVFFAISHLMWGGILGWFVKNN
jgi:hypothetical protein